MWWFVELYICVTVRSWHDTRYRLQGLEKVATMAGGFMRLEATNGFRSLDDATDGTPMVIFHVPFMEILNMAIEIVDLPMKNGDFP